jgi:hypothetical protein
MAKEKTKPNVFRANKKQWVAFFPLKFDNSLPDCSSAQEEKNKERRKTGRVGFSISCLPAFLILSLAQIVTKSKLEIPCSIFEILFLPIFLDERQLQR